MLPTNIASCAHLLLLYPTKEKKAIKRLDYFQTTLEFYAKQSTTTITKKSFSSLNLFGLHELHNY